MNNAVLSYSRSCSVQGSPGPGIQLIDVDDDIFTDELLWEYRSNPVHVGGDSEAEYVHALLPGLSMMVNSHPILPNGKLVFPGIGISLYSHNIFLKI